MQSKYGHTGKSDWKPLGGLVKYKTLVEKPCIAIIYTHANIWFKISRHSDLFVVVYFYEPSAD